jgi:hypothetical protein
MQSIDDANETAEYYPRMNANERESFQQLVRVLLIY